jgi:AraC family transcriptional regulator, transcriptional activator FtrA
MSVPSPDRRTVSVLAYRGMSVFETGIVTEVFGPPRPEFDRPWYDRTVRTGIQDRQSTPVGGR